MILFLVNAFPSPQNIHQSPFNLRAVKSLIAAGIDIQTVHLRSWVPGRSFIHRYEIDGVPITAVSLPYLVKLPTALVSLNLWMYKNLFNQIAPKLRGFKEIELIHSVGAGHAGVVGSALSKAYDIPHIVQCIGSDINLVIPSMKKYFGVKGWEKYVDCFPCNSIELANQVHSLYPSAQTEVIYRGVDLKEFSPDNSKRSGDRMVFTYIGGFTPKEIKPFGIDQKGGVTVLKAWKIVMKSLPAVSVQLRFAGPRVTRESVALAYDGDIDKDCIEVKGQLSKNDVGPLLQSSNVVLIPSMFEGLPNAAMEAAATGAALIGSRVGGIPEVIKDWETGFIIERKDENVLAERIMTLINNRQLADKMGIQGRAYMESRFDKAQFAQGYIKLYEKTLKGR